MQEAYHYFGSKQLKTAKTHEVRNPYNNELVTLRADSTKEDALEMLKIANHAKKAAKHSTLAQRISWLEDVANK